MSLLPVSNSRVLPAESVRQPRRVWARDGPNAVATIVVWEKERDLRSEMARFDRESAIRLAATIEYGGDARRPYLWGRIEPRVRSGPAEFVVGGTGRAKLVDTTKLSESALFLVLVQPYSVLRLQGSCRCTIAVGLTHPQPLLLACCLQTAPHQRRRPSLSPPQLILRLLSVLACSNSLLLSCSGFCLNSPSLKSVPASSTAHDHPLVRLVDASIPLLRRKANASEIVRPCLTSSPPTAHPSPRRGHGQPAFEVFKEPRHRRQWPSQRHHPLHALRDQGVDPLAAPVHPLQDLR
jgi:hypothetical protein